MEEECSVCDEKKSEYLCHVCECTVCFDCMFICKKCCNNICTICINEYNGICESCTDEITNTTQLSNSASNLLGKTKCYGCSKSIDLYENECNMCDAPYCFECIRSCAKCKINVCDECESDNPIKHKLCRSCRSCIKCKKRTKYNCSICNKTLCHSCRYKTNMGRLCDVCFENHFQKK